MSTPYPSTTSESSLGLSSERSLDSSSPSSRPSRKRCRSPTASVPSPTHISRLIASTPTDLLPPRKTFRDSYSPEDSEEEHIEVDTADAEAIADVGISEGVVAHPEDSVGMGFEIAASDLREDDEEFEAEASAADTREIVVDPLAIGDSFESSRGGITDLFLKSLQKQDQNIVEAVSMIKGRKQALVRLKTTGFDAFLKIVNSFCEKHDFVVLKMDEIYVAKRNRVAGIKNRQYFEIDIFNTDLDMQIQEFGDLIYNV
ncbi:putative reverse transcriptase domain-containing protein [Tanacetum coccineum]